MGFTPKGEQVNISHEVRKIFMCFFISGLFSVVAAAIYGDVDCEDYISDLTVLTPFLFTCATAPHVNCYPVLGQV